MTVLDLTKATIGCGGASFLVYSFPQVGQITLISLLALVWLLYAHRTISKLLRK